MPGHQPVPREKTIAGMDIQLHFIRNLDPLKVENRVFVSVHMRMGDACDREVEEELKSPWNTGRFNRPW